MLSFFAFFALSVAAATAETVVLERRTTPPAGFARLGAAPADQYLRLRFALVENNIAGLHDTVHEISTPGSSRYGQYLSKEQIHKFVAPTEDTVSRVNSWLTSNGLVASSTVSSGNWLMVNLTVSQANSLLEADFSTFQHEATNSKVVRTLTYSIPSSLKSHVQWIHPTVSFPTASESEPLVQSQPSTKMARSISADCRGTSQWTPTCIQELYGIPATPAKSVSNGLGVSGFNDAFANHRDLKQFLQTYRPDINPDTTYHFESINDGVDNQLPIDTSGDANINVQLTVGLATGIPVTYFGVGFSDFSGSLDDYLDQANFLLEMENPPSTVLNTFGALPEDFSPAAMMVSVCNAYAQLAARGVSYIVTAPSIFSCGDWTASFPASCPFVTAVGGTEFDPDESQESSLAAGGGGFSTIFERPAYQDVAVQGWLSTTGTTSDVPFNVSGRAVPDVSAIGAIPYVLQGTIMDESKSASRSAAVFASIVALLTSERVAAGKPGLGFLNPMIYQSPQGFKDIVAGNDNSFCPQFEFNATTGWDPATGMGSPIYAILLEVTRNL
ncbi:serine protease S53 [Favolaschia claudopus]|uniref:Serine protease S53 n=1 Tax=Favolaschia claudopus TaxID=2862362 RepID=A0AAW0DUW0_9AGAR